MSYKTRKMYFRVKKTLFGDELWISPAGTPINYFLTTGKISRNKIKKWLDKNNDKIQCDSKKFIG